MPCRGVIEVRGTALLLVWCWSYCDTVWYSSTREKDTTTSAGIQEGGGLVGGSLADLELLRASEGSDISIEIYRSRDWRIDR
ncbi:hypothetical protein HOY82DRAFT_199822 [Tuber indicum]|nr:hypothetical protein HOY82DRAFT_199822 [Tuber indicum]